MVMAQDLSGGASAEESAAIFKTILGGKGTWAQNAVVLANAAMGLFATGKYTDYTKAYEAAVDSLDSGKANQVLQKLLSLQ